MKRQSLFHPRASFNLAKTPAGLHDSGLVCLVPSQLHAKDRNHTRFWLVRAKIPSSLKREKFDIFKLNCVSQAAEFKGMVDENQGELSEADEDDELCPVECVRDFKTDKEFFRILEKAKETNSLVVVDFYRTSCGSCKYIEKAFAKLCKGSGDQDAGVIFLKHNVIDEYDEQSEVAERLRIKAVPLFHFYKDGILLEAFPTRDKERIVAAILKYTKSASEDG